MTIRRLDLDIPDNAYGIYAFSGPFLIEDSTRALTLGRHRASISATDAAGNVAPVRRLSFSVVR